MDSVTRSSSNRQEAAIAARLVAACVQAGVPAVQIGVICFYRSVVCCILKPQCFLSEDPWGCSFQLMGLIDTLLMRCWRAYLLAVDICCYGTSIRILLQGLTPELAASTTQGAGNADMYPAAPSRPACSSSALRGCTLFGGGRDGEV